MTTTEPTEGLTRLLRPHVGSFAAVVVLQVIGAVAGLAPLLAVVELGRTLLSPGPVDDGHVWTVVIIGAVGLFVRLVFTAASSGLGHVVDGKVQLTLRRALAARLGLVPIGWFSRRRMTLPPFAGHMGCGVSDLGLTRCVGLQM